jgi:hypothetical protein
MRALPESNDAEREEHDSDGALLRGGVLLRPEQRQSEPAPQVRFELLLAFTRQLVRNTVSRDALFLAFYAALHDCNLPEGEEARQFWKAVVEQRECHSMWPKDF